MENNEQTIKISVRNLVEFILRSGDLDNRGGGKDVEAMQEGSRLHRKIQKRMGSNYSAEVPLTLTVPQTRDGLEFNICIEGRADGIITGPEESPSIIIDEIKCVYADLNHIEEMSKVHKAQVMCYAYIYALKHDVEEIGIRLTYCNIETEAIKEFEEVLNFAMLKEWFDNLISEYCKWAAWQYHWRIKRDESIKKIEFPFSYREGQKDLVTGVYRSILRNKQLFIEAPTGVGKTISTVFPTVKAMGEGHIEKIFYLTAKTITRTVAEETFHILKKQNLLLKIVTITAKEKLCILDKPNCNPVACERAKGHFDRVNDAVFDMLLHEESITRDLINEYAKKHIVCPFEMCLDVTTWADAIVCDYNYVFDPNVYLRRFFTSEKKQDYAFLIDEAHNLVDRAREMYSATLYKEDFMHAKRYMKEKHNGLYKQLEECNKQLLFLKRECDSMMVLENAGTLVLPLLRFISEFDDYSKEVPDGEGKEELLSLYFAVRQFLYIHDLVDENYMIYTDYEEDGRFKIKLLCMDPSKNLRSYLNKGRSSIFFSATLLPIQYYKEQLGGKEEDYAIYAPSPFEEEKRLLMIANDVSTKYSRRNEAEYDKIIDYIDAFTSAKMGNYFVFFPSYAMMNQIAERAKDKFQGVIVQRNMMSELEKEQFLESFKEEPNEMTIGFCVMGGIFSEGIDLKKERLIGTIIVGTGLPLVCNERELFKQFYDQRNHRGFDYAYLYPGMNKVLQSAGRVIRTSEDKGAILLLDDRFLTMSYQQLFPLEWSSYHTVIKKRMIETLQDFWGNQE